MRSLLWCLLMATTLSRDIFTGGDAASLTGRIPDGGGVPAQATGTYARDNNLGTPGTDEIAISAGVGIALGPDGARYGLGGIPSLPANYRTIGEFLFPDRASGTRCDGITAGGTIATNGADWKNQGGTTDTGNPNLSTLVIDGPLAGTSMGGGTWTDSPENTNDPLTLTDEGVGANIEAAAYVDGMGLGPSVGIRLTAHITDKSLPVASTPPFYPQLAYPSTTRFEAGFYADLTLSGGKNRHSYTVILERDNDGGDPDVVTWLFGISAFGSGTPIEVTGLNVDEPIEIELRVFQLGPGQRSLLCGYLNGDLILSRLSGNTASVRMPFIKAFFLSFLDSVEVFSLSGAPTGGLGDIAYATQEVMVKWDKDTSTGYILRTEFFEDADLPTVDYYLEEWSAGVATGLRYTAQLPITYGTGLISSLEYNAGKLYARDTAGALIWDNGSGQSFDVAVDVADDTAATVASHTTGDPGFGGYDGTGFFLTITEHRVEGEGVPCIPSTGGGGGGPGGGGSGSPAFMWVMKNGAWRPVPTPSATTDNVQVMANGAWRPARKGWVMKNGAWRELPQGNPSVNGDPGTPDGPPLPSCDDPTPWIPVDPEPLTDRLFFVWEMAVNLINATPFTAVVTSLGSWTPGDIATAVSLGGQIISSQGNYTKFQTGGAYDPAKMDAWIASQIPIEAGLNVPGYYGCSVIDDFNWSPAWPPSGVSLSEIARFCAVWKAQFPWQRLTIRGRPRELLGQNFSGLLDSCIAQWHTRFGDPTAFRTAELAAAASIGVPAILWSMNFTNGGDGSSGIPGTLAGMWEMSAAEVLDVGSVFTDPATEATGIANHGVGGWKCNRPGQPPILSRSGMVAALTTVRNQLAAL